MYILIDFLFQFQGHFQKFYLCKPQYSADSLIKTSQNHPCYTQVCEKKTRQQNQVMNAVIWTTVQKEQREIQNSRIEAFEQDRESRKRQGVHHNYIIPTTIHDMHHNYRVYTTLTGCTPQLQDVHRIYRIYTTITGYTPQLKDAHHIYRVNTTFTGCTPQLRDAHHIYRTYTTIKGCTPHLKDVHHNNRVYTITIGTFC